MKGTVKAVAHALITESTDVSGATTITYGELKYHKTKLSGTRQVSLDPKSSSKEIWADGVVAFAGQTNQGYEGTITTLDLCDDLEKDWYGNVIEEKNGTLVEVARTGEAPKFGLIVQYESTSEAEGYTEVFPYCYTTDRTKFSVKTEEDSGMDYEYTEHKIACKPSPAEATVNNKKGHIARFRIKGNTVLTKFPEYTYAPGE
jgi:hypothetical protein